MINNPFFSIKIPTYNCAKYLKETLISILDQDMGPALMEIEVIDDCSNLDNPEEIVKYYGRGKVQYFRQPYNVGSVKNFNTCINRSVGKWIHILHGDDIVHNKFYSKYYDTINKYKNVCFVASRVNFINKNSSVIWEQPEYDKIFELPFKSSNLQDYNLFNTPSVVVKSEVYKNIGQFNDKLNHTADWEMWARILFSEYGVILNEILASWRDFQDSETKTVRKNGNEIIDYANATKEISRLYGFKEYNLNTAINQADKNMQYFFESKDYKSFLNNRSALKSLLPMHSILKYDYKYLIKYISQLVNNKNT